MNAACLIDLRFCDSEPMVREDGWLEVGCVFGLDPRLVDWISQLDMNSNDFILEFMIDALDIFKAYLNFVEEDNNSVKE